MPLISDLQRRRLALASALRRFSIIDHFGFDELICMKSAISIDDILEVLRRNPEELPKSIPIAFIAKSIHADLIDDRRSSEDELVVRLREKDIEILERIRPGRSDAPKYHNYMLRVMPFIFDGKLANPKKEQPLASSSKYIDIVFDNVATDGFFWEIVAHHHVVAGHVIVECKNYFDDPANPEFDQLSGRLGKGTGQIGILTCRTIGDEAKALTRQRDALHRDDKRILIITDDDVTKMIRSMVEDQGREIDDLLRSKLRNLDFS